MPPSAPHQARQLVEAVAATEPVDHGLPGHGRAPKELRQGAPSPFGRRAGRDAIRRTLTAAKRLWGWMGEEVARGPGPSGREAWRAACPQSIAEIKGGPEAMADRLWHKFELDPEQGEKLLVPT